MTYVDLGSQAIRKSIPKDFREGVALAHRLGWKAKHQGTGLVLLSPDGVHTVRVSATTRNMPGNGNLAKRTVQDILRWSPQQAKSDLADLIDEVGVGLELGDPQAVAQVLPLEADLAPVLEVGKAFGFSSRDLDPDVPSDPEPTVVSQEPWMARTHVSVKTGTSDLYPSQSVVQRTWSDGSTDYVCAVCGEYASPKPRSVAAHSNIHTRRGERPPVDTTPTVFDATIDGPRTIRVATLAREIGTALAEVDRGEDTEAWARDLATHIIMARIAKGQETDHVPAEPLTAEQMLDRIRAMVGREDQRALAQAETHAANLRAQIVQVEQERDAARAEAARRKQAMAAFAEMAKIESEDNT